MKIDTTKSIDQLRAELAMEFVRLYRGKQKKTWTCTHCGQPESGHMHYDGRCTAYVTSLIFRADETTRIANIETALRLFDQLRAMEIK